MDIKNLLQNILDIAYDKYINLIKVYSQTDFNVTINNLKEKDETDFEQDEDTIFPGLIVNATMYEDSADTYIINFYMLNADLSRTDVLTSIVDLVRSSQYDLSIKVIEKKDTKLTNINCYNNTHEIFVNSASMKLKIVHKSCTCTTNTKPRLVTSVNGQTGDVFLPDYKGAVTSVNGQVGDVDIFIPTKTSDLVNDSDFATNEETDAKLETKQDNLIYYKEFTDEAYAHVQIPNGGQVIVDGNKAQVSYGPKGVIINDADVMIFDRQLQDSIAGKNWTTNLIDEKLYVIDSSIKNIEEILEGKQEKIDGFYQDGMVTELKPNDTLPVGGKLVVSTMGAALEYEDNEEIKHSIRVLNNGAFYDNKEIALKDDIVDAYTKEETNKLLTDSSVYNAGKYATIDSLNTFITEQHNVDESQNTAIDGITTDLSNLETTVTGLADDVLDISTKVSTLDSSYLDLHLTNIDDLGKQTIKDIVGAGDKLNHYKEYSIGTPEDGMVVETAKIYDTEESIENFFMGYQKEKYYEEGEEIDTKRFLTLQDVNEETGAKSTVLVNRDFIQIVNNIDNKGSGIAVIGGEVYIGAENDIVLHPIHGKVKIGEDEVATETYVDSKIGDINTILETI